MWWIKKGIWFGFSICWYNNNFEGGKVRTMMIIRVEKLEEGETRVKDGDEIMLMGQWPRSLRKVKQCHNCN